MIEKLENRLLRWMVPILLAGILGLLIYIWQDQKALVAQNNADFKLILKELTNSINLNENVGISHENRIQTIEKINLRQDLTIESNTKEIIKLNARYYEK